MANQSKIIISHEEGLFITKTAKEVRKHDKRITYKNLHKFYSYIPLDEDEKDDPNYCNKITVKWDSDNNLLNELISNEIYPKLGQRVNMMWIEKIKEHSNWKRGEKLFIGLKHKCDGWFNAWYSKTNKRLCGNCITVEEDGYVSRRYLKNYSSIFSKTTCVRDYPESIYNDNVFVLNNRNLPVNQDLTVDFP